MKKTSAFLNLVVVFSMLLAMAAVQPTAASAKQDPPPPDKPLSNLSSDLYEDAVAELAKAEKSAPVEKIDPSLREAAEKGGTDLLEIYVSARRGVDLSKFMTQMTARPELFQGIHNIYGFAKADDLLAIAARPGVIAVVNAASQPRDLPADPEQETAKEIDPAALKARIEELRKNEVSYAEAVKAGGIGASGWFDVLDGHKSKEAWDKGFTGQGVVVGVLDDGVDFAHPDLQGTYARVTDEYSPYYGWPMAFSQISAKYFNNEVRYQDLGAEGITQNWNGSHWISTMDSYFVPTCFGCTTGTADYTPVDSIEHTYTIPLTSQSSTYKMGSLNERNLLAVYGEYVAILVVDEGSAGTFDTVYVDLDNDYDFTDEKPATKDSPEVYREMDGDGYADISGGLVVWISDGENVPPTTDWLWGLSCGMGVGTLKACPDAGELVIFTGPWEEDTSSHGTLCASNVVAQGVINGGASTPDFVVGGVVQGSGKEAKVMDFSNHYYNGTDEDEYAVAAAGYDGSFNSGDEIQITSNSYGAFSQMWGGWGYMGRLITMINTTFGPTTMYVFSGGNEGPGYGPQEGEGGPTMLKIGTSTQFGSTNWDSIAGIDQIVYGDPSSFGSKGPNRDGSAGLDVLANGGRGSGDEALNMHGFDGSASWDTWGGTSRSAPHAAGNLALLYQAFKAANGRWPTWNEVMPIVKSSATNAASSPFLQGGGVLNSDRATDVASGAYGVYATPDEWQVGDWEGTQYLNFAKVAVPGETYTQEYTVKNPSGYDITVDLSDGYMQRMSEKEYTFTTSSQAEESGFNFHSPDYLMSLDPSIIPADAELMVVRYVHPYSTYDPDENLVANSSWRFLLYNWTDINGDGKLWEDKNGNGTVNHEDSEVLDNDGFFQVDYTNPDTEIQQGEYIRMDYEFGGIGIPIFVHEPTARMADGYFCGFQHRANDGTIDKTTLQIRVEFYKRADWSWLSLDKTTLAVPAKGEANFLATAAVPADAEAGAYEGVIYMNDPGDARHPAHESALPVVFNVMYDLADGGYVALGGGERQDTLYQNSWTNGYFNWYGGGWTGAGDWRHYFFNVDEADVEKDNLLVHTKWDDVRPTDINTWVLGPTEDCASNGTGTCAWYSSFGQPNQNIYGPYTLQPIASSGPFMGGATYPFETSTGGPDDWLLAPLGNPGLHEIALHNVSFSGEQMDTQFGVEVGTLSMKPGVDPANGWAYGSAPVHANVFAETGQVDLAYTPSLAINSFSATLRGGLATNTYPQPDVVVPNNNGGAGGGYTAWLADNVFRPLTIDTFGTTQLTVHAIMPPTSDGDLFLVRDNNNDGVATQGVDTLVGSSGNSTGTDEEITLNNPQLAQYLVVFAGYDMDPASGATLGWWYRVTAPGSLPAEDNYVYSDVLTMTQAASLDPTSGIPFTITTSDHTSGIHATLTGITVSTDVDLYLMDGDGNIVARSQTAGNADEAIDLLPPEGEYRFAEGLEYTLWVHGPDVYTEIYPVLNFWSNELNLWLADSTDADVHLNGIAAGETVTVSLMYDKPGMAIGDMLSARVVAGPESMEEALSNLVNITMVEDTGIPDAPVDVEKTIYGPRGRTYAGYYSNSSYGIDLDATGVAPGDEVIVEVTAENVGSQAGWVEFLDFWTGSYWDFNGFVDPAPTYNVYTGTVGCFNAARECVSIFANLEPGETTTYQFKLLKTADMGTGNPYASFSNYVFALYAEGDGVRAASPFFWDVAGVVGFMRYWWSADEQQPAMDDFNDLSSKTAPATVLPGGAIEYKLHLVNPTSYESPDIPDFYLKDALPEAVVVEATGVTASSGDVAYDAATHTVTWMGDVPFEGVDITIQGSVAADVEMDTTIVNIATVATKFEGEPFAWLLALTRVTDGKVSNLAVTKQVDKLLGNNGAELGYTITVKNEGDAAASEAYMLDTLSPYLILDEATLTASAGEVAFDGTTIEWTGDLAAGASVTITFTAAVNPTTPGGRYLVNLAEAGEASYAVFDSVVTEVLGFYSLFFPITTR